MATKLGTIKPRLEPVGTSLLEQLSDLDASSMSPETARKLLQLKFDTSHQERVDVLGRKAQGGTLSGPEEAELDEYIRVANLLAILQSRARRALESPTFADDRRRDNLARLCEELDAMPAAPVRDTLTNCDHDQILHGR